MKPNAISNTVRRGFTLVELIAVIIVLAILAGVAVPKYFDYSTQAKESAAKATLGNARSAIANFYANETLTNSTGRYPTLAELETAGTVLDRAFPENPYNGSNDVRQRRWNGQGAAPIGGRAGWNYDDRSGRFWANSDTDGVDENEW